MAAPNLAALDELLFRCTVRITTGAGGEEGTGFFVAPGVILTCAHVVKDTLTSGQPIMVHWQNQRTPQSVTIMERTDHPYPDIALLEFPTKDHPCVLFSEPYHSGQMLYSYGYPGNVPTVRAESISVEVEGPTHGGTEDAPEEQLKFKFGQIYPGVSGAALLNHETGGVCGIIRTTREREGDLGGFAIPTSVILSRFPRLRELQREFHRKDPTWLDTAWGSGLNVVSIADGVPTVGGAALQSIANAGDFSELFHGKYQGLRSSYLSPNTIFQRVHIDRFQGRVELKARVDQFLKNENQGYIILEADAGLGKTSFLAHLVKERNYFHHFIKRASRPEDMAEGVKSIAAQLLRVWDLEFYRDEAGLKAAASRADLLEQLLNAAAKRRDELAVAEPIVLVVDALDEAWMTGQNVLGLPEKLPKGVYVLTSRRPVKVDLRVADEHVIKLLVNSDEDKRDMQAYLEAAAARFGLTSYPQDQRPAIANFVSMLLGKSRGLWIYLHYVIEEIEGKKRSLFDLDLPDGLWKYYADFWIREKERAGNMWDMHLRVLCTLGALQESATPTALTQLAEVSLPPEAVERLLREHWRPFLDIEGKTGRSYRLYHTSLRDFLEGKVKPEERGDADVALMDELKEATLRAHSRLADRYLNEWGGLSAGMPGLSEPKHRNADRGYGLRHVAAHLEAAGRDLDLHSLLLLKQSYLAQVSAKRTGFVAWINRLFNVSSTRTVTRHRLVWQTTLENLGDLESFLGDLQRGWRMAVLAGKNQALTEPRSLALGLQCHYALITASINSLAANMPSGVLVAALRLGIYSLEYTLTYARQTPDKSQRTGLLSEIASWLAQVGRSDEALDLVREIALDRGYVAPALATMAAHFTDRTIRPAILLLEREPLVFHGQALPALLAQLAKLGGAEEALVKARAMETGFYRTLALSKILAFLSDEQRKEVAAEALRDARPINADETGAELLSSLLPHLDPTDGASLIQEALASARAMPDVTSTRKRPARPLALLRLVPYLTHDEKRAVLSEVRVIAASLPESGDPDFPSLRAKVLFELMPKLPLSERAATFNEALHLARNVSERQRGLALAQLSAEMTEALLEEALDATLAPGRFLKESALNALAPHLSERLISKALETLATIDDSKERELLAWLLFETGDFDAALSAAAGLTNRYNYSPLAEALTTFADRLPSMTISSALRLIKKRLHENDLAKALCALAPHLPPELLPEALAVARTISDSDGQAQALICLANRSPGKLTREAILATIKSKSMMSEAKEIRRLVQQLDEHSRTVLLGELKARAQEESKQWTGKEVITKNTRLPERWIMIQNVVGFTRRLIVLALMQDPVERDDTLMDALEKAIAIENTSQRLEALEGLVYHLGPLQLRQARHLIGERLKEADSAIDQLAEWFRSLGISQELITAFQQVNTKGELNQVMETIWPLIVKPPPYIQDSWKKLLFVDEWLKAMSLLAPRFAAAGFEQEAVEILSEIRAGERLLAYAPESFFSSSIGNLSKRALIRMIPFLTAPYLEQATTMRTRDDAEVEIAVAEAKLGMHHQALKRAQQIWSDRDRAKALVGLIPHLPESVLRERSKVSQSRFQRRLQQQQGRIGAAVTSTSQEEVERSVLELALFAAVEFEGIPQAFTDKNERSQLLSLLVPYLTQLPLEEMYNLWCELLPVLATRSRRHLTDDLRALIPVIDLLGGRKALMETREALIAVDQCFP